MGKEPKIKIHFREETKSKEMVDMVPPEVDDRKKDAQMRTHQDEWEIDVDEGAFVIIQVCHTVSQVCCI